MRANVPEFENGGGGRKETPGGGKNYYVCISVCIPYVSVSVGFY